MLTAQIAEWVAVFTSVRRAAARRTGKKTTRFDRQEGMLRGAPNDGGGTVGPPEDSDEPTSGTRYVTSG